MDENPYRAPLAIPAARFPPTWIKRLRMTLAEWLVLLACIAWLTAFLLPVVQAVRAAQRRSQCSPEPKYKLPEPPAHSSKPAIAPSPPGSDARGLARFRMQEPLARLLSKVRREANDLLRAFIRFGQRPWRMIPAGCIIIVGLLAVAQPRTKLAERDTSAPIREEATGTRTSPTRAPKSEVGVVAIEH
ncbi:MAG TPA: hypothetical protein VFW87_08595 [Pirellulales bacterium]|nr:hypothetical protein [Pirellulales bacterium]